jgi:hypothetical protein
MVLNTLSLLCIIAGIGVAYLATVFFASGNGELMVLAPMMMLTWVTPMWASCARLWEQWHR